MTGTFIERKNSDTDMHGRRMSGEAEGEAEIRVMLLQTKGCWQRQKPAGGLGRSLPHSPQAEQPCRQFDLRLHISITEMVNFCCVKPPSAQQFITAAPGLGHKLFVRNCPLPISCNLVSPSLQTASSSLLRVASMEVA